MPDVLMLHERNALAFDGLRHDGLRCAIFIGLQLYQGLIQRRFVMAIHRDGVEAKRFEFGLQATQLHDVRSGAHCLEAVFVDDHD